MQGCLLNTIGSWKQQGLPLAPVFFLRPTAAAAAAAAAVVAATDDWKVTYNCTANSTPPGLPIPFELALTVKVTDTAAPFCSDSAYAREELRGSKLPIVNVTADAYAPFCAPDGQVYVSFTVESTVEYSANDWTLSVNVTDPATGVPDCSFKSATNNTSPTKTTLGEL
jgi:hypothetical protein